MRNPYHNTPPETGTTDRIGSHIEGGRRARKNRAHEEKSASTPSADSRGAVECETAVGASERRGLAIAIGFFLAMVALALLLGVSGILVWDTDTGSQGQSISLPEPTEQGYLIAYDDGSYVHEAQDGMVAFKFENDEGDLVEATCCICPYGEHSTGYSGWDFGEMGVGSWLSLSLVEGDEKPYAEIWKCQLPGTEVPGLGFIPSRLASVQPWKGGDSWKRLVD